MGYNELVDNRHFSLYGKPMPDGVHAGSRSWRNKRKCAKLTPAEADSIFFVKAGGKSKAAKAYCSDCPVLSNCLDEQIRLGGPGFWAGTTEEERRRMAQFLKLVPMEVEDFAPPIVRRKVRSIKKEPNILSDPLYGVQGPSPEEELKMLEGFI